MRTRMFYIEILSVLLLSHILVSPEIASAEITEFTPSNHQAAALVLGQPDFITSASATTQTGMNSPFGIAVDPTTGKVFVADMGNSRVLRFASVTALGNGVAAEGVLGQVDFISGLANRGGLVAPNTLNQPLGVFVDSSGRLWVTDYLNNRVLRYDNAASKGNGVDADAVLGQPDLNSNAFATTQAGMHYPADLFVDSSGRLWVSDLYNHRVIRFDNAAAKPNGANANGVLGQPNFTSNAPATTQNGMRNPGGLFIDSSGRLWVADHLNHRVLRFDNAAAKSNGANANGVLGQNNFTSNTNACTQGGMKNPQGVSGDPTGRLYVTDSINHRVLIFENAAVLGNGANANNVLGQSNFTTCSPNNGELSSMSLNNPSGVFYDPAINVLWTAELSNHRVLMYGNTGQSANLVLGQADFVSNATATTRSGMDSPFGVAVDPITGKVFVADQFNHRVLRFTSVTSLSNGAMAEGVLGQADFVSGLPNRGGSTAVNSMNQPIGAFLDANGRLWVADYGNHRVLRFDNAATKPNGANANGVLGQSNFTSSIAATTQSSMNQPFDVFVESNGRLWVADYLNNRVLRFDNAAAKINGANADGVLGQSDFTSNTGATTQDGMSGPSGVFVDLGGRLWVAERNNHRVLRFDDAAAKSDGANANGVLGQLNFTTSTHACSQNGMYRPRGVSGDLSGRLYVADGDNNRVLIFENAAGLPNNGSANDLLGQPNFTLCNVNTGGVSAASMHTPTRAIFDTTANVLWVTDWNNNRVLMYGVPRMRIFLPIVGR